jgi:hypothetical protein
MQLVTALLMMALIGCSSADASKSSSEEKKMEQASWRVEVATEGGLAGRGLGSIQIASSGDATAADLARSCSARLDGAEVSSLAALVEKTRPSAWPEVAARPESPRGEFDQVRYTLTLSTTNDSGAETVSHTSWFDQSLEREPDDVRQLAKALWDERERILDGCAK